MDTDRAEHLSMYREVQVRDLLEQNTRHVANSELSAVGIWPVEVGFSLALHQGLANKAVMDGGRGLACLYLVLGAEESAHPQSKSCFWFPRQHLNMHANTW